ncbi:unnamed protein product [Closterium sp. NIES-65]|nr:unnamed protein product [Closterium sp. NIES-65]
MPWRPPKRLPCSVTKPFCHLALITPCSHVVSPSVVSASPTSLHLSPHLSLAVQLCSVCMYRGEPLQPLPPALVPPCLIHRTPPLSTFLPPPQLCAALKRVYRDEPLSPLPPALLHSHVEAFSTNGALTAGISYHRAFLRGLWRFGRPVPVPHRVLVLWAGKDKYARPHMAQPPPALVPNAQVVHFPEHRSRAAEMRVKRQREVRRHVRFYRTSCGFREPFKAVADGTFLHHVTRLRLSPLATSLPKLLGFPTRVHSGRATALGGRVLRRLKRRAGGILAELQRRGDAVNASSPLLSMTGHSACPPLIPPPLSLPPPSAGGILAELQRRGDAVKASSPLLSSPLLSSPLLSSPLLSSPLRSSPLLSSPLLSSPLLSSPLLSSPLLSAPLLSSPLLSSPLLSSPLLSSPLLSSPLLSSPLLSSPLRSSPLLSSPLLSSPLLSSPLLSSPLRGGTFRHCPPHPSQRERETPPLSSPCLTVLHPIISLPPTPPMILSAPQKARRWHIGRATGLGERLLRHFKRRAGGILAELQRPGDAVNASSPLLSMTGHSACPPLIPPLFLSPPLRRCTLAELQRLGGSFNAFSPCSSWEDLLMAPIVAFESTQKSPGGRGAFKDFSPLPMTRCSACPPLIPPPLTFPHHPNPLPQPPPPSRRCILAELQRLGDAFKDTRFAARQLEVARCTHEGDEAVTASECIQHLVAGGNQQHFFVASQDIEFKKLLKKVRPGPFSSQRWHRDATCSSSPRAALLHVQLFSTCSSSPRAALLHVQLFSTCSSSPRAALLHVQLFSTCSSSPGAALLQVQLFSRCSSSPRAALLHVQLFSTCSSSPRAALLHVQLFSTCSSSPRAALLHVQLFSSLLFGGFPLGLSFDKHCPHPLLASFPAPHSTLSFIPPHPAQVPAVPIISANGTSISLEPPSPLDLSLSKKSESARLGLPEHEQQQLLLARAAKRKKRIEETQKGLVPTVVDRTRQRGDVAGSERKAETGVEGGGEGEGVSGSEGEGRDGAGGEGVEEGVGGAGGVNSNADAYGYGYDSEEEGEERKPEWKRLGYVKDRAKFKRKRVKGPNPLSCKKKARPAGGVGIEGKRQGMDGAGPKKRQRRRRKGGQAAEGGAVDGNGGASE